MKESAAAAAEMLDCWSLCQKNVMSNSVEHKTGFFRSDGRRNDRSSLRRFKTGFYRSECRSNDRSSLRRFKTGFYRSEGRSNDGSSLRRFTLLAGPTFRRASALPDTVFWGGRISHCSTFLHVSTPVSFFFSFGKADDTPSKKFDEFFFSQKNSNISWINTLGKPTNNNNKISFFGFKICKIW